jgi:hypothetical protein
MIEYKETELPCENPIIRKWINTDKYIWFTDLKCNYLGESLEEAIECYEDWMMRTQKVAPCNT